MGLSVVNIYLFIVEFDSVIVVVVVVVFLVILANDVNIAVLHKLITIHWINLPRHLQGLIIINLISVTTFLLNKKNIGPDPNSEHVCN